MRNTVKLLFKRYLHFTININVFLSTFLIKIYKNVEIFQCIKMYVGKSWKKGSIVISANTSPTEKKSEGDTYLSHW